MRAYVLRRDNYMCSWCKENGLVTTSRTTRIDVDHIKEVKDFPHLRLDEDNLRCLCMDCHNKRHEKWFGKYKVSKSKKYWGEEDEWW